MVGKLSGLHWESDWEGIEVGHPEIPIVGLYHSPTLNISMYLDMEKNEVLELLPLCDEEKDTY